MNLDFNSKVAVPAERSVICLFLFSYYYEKTKLDVTTIYKKKIEMLWPETLNYNNKNKVNNKKNS